MKKIYRLMAAAVAAGALCCWTGCGEEKEVKDDNVWHVAVDPVYAPFAYYENGNLCGIDVEILNRIAELNGIKLYFDEIKFADSALMLGADGCDIIASGVTVTAGRRKLAEFTTPYMESRLVLLGPADSPLKTVEDLKNVSVRIGAQSRSTAAEFLQRLGREPETYELIGPAVADLLNNKLHAVCLDAEPAEVYARRHSKLDVLPVELEKGEFAFAVRKGDTALLEKLNASILQLKKSGELEEILKKYQKTEDL